jgi:gamma-glutamylcyclotransferase (GGCT)/AIG2-like uncharacterized protein YtfP
MPENPSKLFVYGSLKPGELGFEQIEKLVSNHRAAELHDFALYVRDGLPVIKKPATGETVSGVLLSINAGMEEAFWRVVTEYEGTTNYKLENSLPVISEGKEFLAGAFIGRKMGKGNPEKLYTPWTSKLDPIFSHSFPLLHRDIAGNTLKFTDAEYDPVAYWSQMNGLLSQYLLLVSILEHLTVVKFGGSKKQEPMVRIRKLQESQGFANAFNALIDEKNNPLIKVSDSRAVEDSLSSSNPEQVLLAWYQVRSNLQHRGKASLFDAKLVQKSCVGLSNFLLEYLTMNIKEIESEWEKFLDVKLTKCEFVENF